MRYSLSKARQLAARGEFKEALTNYFIILKDVGSDVIEQYVKEFVSCLTKFVETRNPLPDVIKALVAPSLELFATNATVHLTVGDLLCSRQMYNEAMDVFRRLLHSCQPSQEDLCAVRVCQANLTSHLFPSWHMIMLNNKKRNSVYAEAIRRIPAGKTVLEIGSGTGLLSAVAQRQGLDVVAVEESVQLCQVTSKVLEMNRANSTSLALALPCNSNKLDIEKEIGRKADIVVAEIFDCCALGEGVIESFVDAHRRLTIPHAIFIPNSVAIYATLVQSETLFKIHAHSNWRSEYVNTGDSLPSDPYWCGPLNEYKDVKLLSEPVEVMNINLSNVDELEKLMDEAKSGCFGLRVSKEGTAHCLAVHWRASLGADLVLDSGMDGSCWDFGIYPLRHPRDVHSGDVLPVTLSLSDGGRRLDLVLSEELTHEPDDVITVPGKYFTLCGDADFAAKICSQIPSTASTVLVTSPFDYRTHLADRFTEVDLTNPVDDSFGALLVNNGIEICDEIGPPYEITIFWPVLPDGSLDDQALSLHMPMQISSWSEDYASRHRRNGLNVRTPVSTCVPGMLSCVGQLICSDSLAEKCRLQPQAHLGFDLKSPDHPMRLFECRDIHLDCMEHKIHSSEFPIFDFNLQEIFDSPTAEHSYTQATKLLEIECESDGEVDGVLYWWKAVGYESRAQPCAAFVFGSRYQVTKGQRLPIRVDVYKGQLLVTLASESPTS